MLVGTNPTREEFLNRIFLKSRSQNSLEHAQKALGYFNSYLMTTYNQEHNKLNNTDSKYYADVVKPFEDQFIKQFSGKEINDVGIYNACNSIVTHMGHLSPTSCMGYFSVIKRWLTSQGVLILDELVKNHVTFPKQIRERKTPLSLEQVQMIIKNSIQKYRVLYGLLATSGLRVTEALSLRVADFDFDLHPVRIRVRAETTKTQEERETYTTREIISELKPLIRNKDSNKLIFWNYEPKRVNPNAAVKYFCSLRTKIGMDDQKYLTGYRTLNQHAFRAYFFTKAALKHGDSYAHAITGHHAYLAQYFRLPQSEREQMYLDLEPDLKIFEDPKSAAIIRRQQRDIEQISRNNEELKEKFAMFEAYMRRKKMMV